MTSAPAPESVKLIRYELQWLIPLALWAGVQTWIADGTKLVPSYSFFAFSIAALVGGVALLWLVVKWKRAGVDQPFSRLRDLLAARWPRLLIVVLGIQISSMGFAAFTRIKLLIPSVVPFYADPPLAAFDHWLFGQDAWIAFGWVFGWATPVIFGVYWCWMLVQMIAYPIVLTAVPSRRKTHILLAHAVTWAVLGMLCAFAFSSAGPLFYDRMMGGNRFGGLDDPYIAAVADYLWKSYIEAEPGVGVGISAMPSMHVAGATWLALVIRSYFPKFAWLGWTYVGLIYVGSVMTGWHYATDGIAGAIGAVGCWLFVGQLLRDRPATEVAKLPRPATA